VGDGVDESIKQAARGVGVLFFPIGVNRLKHSFFCTIWIFKDVGVVLVSHCFNMIDSVSTRLEH
jgi:hypothetical protein